MPQIYEKINSKFINFLRNYVVRGNFVKVTAINPQDLIRKKRGGGKFLTESREFNDGGDCQ